MRPRFLFACALALAAAPLAPAAASLLGEDALPRIEDPLCAGVMGLQRDAALQLIDRIAARAEELDIAIADPESCRPNLLVSFVDEPGAALEAMMKAQPRLFDSMTPAQRRALRAGSSPVRSWNLVATRTRDGMIVSERDNLMHIPQATMWSAHSKIYVATRKDIIHSLVLIDAQAAEGLNMAQLADYVAMRAFANDLTEHPAPEGSILTLFDGGTRPQGLSEADRAFLATLYAGIPNLPATSRKRDGMARWR